MALVVESGTTQTSSAEFSGILLEPVRANGSASLWLGLGQHLLGSSPECNHVLKAQGVQPRHCEIRVEGNRPTVRALDARTWLNGGPLRQGELHQGDRLIIGPLEFRVSVKLEPQQPTRVPRTSAVMAASSLPAVEATVACPSPVVPSAPSASDAIARQLSEMETRLKQFEAVLSERADELEQRAQSLAGFEEALARRSFQVRDQESDLARRAGALDGQQQLLRDREAQLSRRFASLEEQETVLREKQQALDAQKLDLENQLRRAARAAAAPSGPGSGEVDAALAEREALLEQRAAALDQKEAAVSRRELQTANREGVVQQRESALQQREESLDQQASAIDERNAALNEREAALLRRETTLRGRESAAQQREANNDRREAVLEQRDQGALERQAELEQRRAELGVLEARVAERNRQCQERDALFAEEQAALRISQQELQSKEARLGERIQNHAAREKTLLEREKAIATRDSQHAERVRELNLREEELNSRLRTLESRETAVHDRESALEERDAVLSHREGAWQEREASLAQREQGCLVRKQEQEKRHADLIAREARLNSRETELAAREQQLEQAIAEAAVHQAQQSAEAPAAVLARHLQQQSEDRKTIDTLQAALEAERQERAREQDRWEADRETLIAEAARAQAHANEDRAEDQIDLAQQIESLREEIRREKTDRSIERASAQQGLIEAEGRLREAERQNVETEKRREQLERECALLRKNCEQLEERLRAVAARPSEPTLRSNLESKCPETSDRLPVRLVGPAQPAQPAPSAPTAKDHSACGDIHRVGSGSQGAETVHVDDATNPDSVAAYMERLLARSRKPNVDGEVCWLPSQSTPKLERQEPRIEEISLIAPVRTELPEPSHKHDRESARVDLDKLRHLANSAARTAIAKHSSRAIREKLRTGTVLCVACFILGAALLIARRWGFEGHSRIAWLAFAAAMAVGFDLLRRTYHHHTGKSHPRQRAVELRPRRAEDVQSPNGEAPEATETRPTNPAHSTGNNAAQSAD